MLDLQQLREQFPDFSAYQSQEQSRLARQLEQALGALAECGPHWRDLRAQVETTRTTRLVAGLREDPTGRYTAPARPTPLTVVATDGSQIFPDRHVEPHCYLLNISRIAFQYGTYERPLMESVPYFQYRREDFRDQVEDLLASATAEVVSALRDEFELRALLDVAREARIPGRPLLALADGTLIRWMIRGMQNRALEQQLIANYTEVLSQFQEERIPLCSYISMPGTTEVVNLLRVHRGETDEEPPSETTLLGVLDRWIFEGHLKAGERSAVFESASHIQRAYGVQDRICYFYVRVPARGRTTEIARVEIPAWVAEEGGVLDLIHATVLSECEKGDGYPMILSEAHEQAVIRAQERGLFYDMVEREMQSAGLRHVGSQKASSKRRPLI